MRTTLADDIRSYLDDEEVALNPNDPKTEVATNTWAYSVAGSDPELASEVVAALRETAEGLRVRLETSETRGKFYAWYDEQAGQLRCSLTSLESLPFGATLREVYDPREIVNAALAHGTVDLSEAIEEAPADYVGETGPTLAVWVAHV